MQELVNNPYFLTALCLAVCCILLLFGLAKRKRDVLELQQDLDKAVLDFNLLVEKYEHLRQVKNQLDQAVVKAQTTTEGLQIRLSERDEKLHALQTELEQEQSHFNKTTENFTALRGRFGEVSAQAEGLQRQLMESRETLERKEREMEKA